MYCGMSALNISHGPLKNKISLTIAEKGKSKFCNWRNQILLPDLKESNFCYVHCREIYRRMWFTFLYSLFSHFAAEFEKFWLFCKFSCYNSIFLNFTPNTLKKEPFIYPQYYLLDLYLYQSIQYYLTISLQRNSRKSGFYDTLGESESPQKILNFISHTNDGLVH